MMETGKIGYYEFSGFANICHVMYRNRERFSYAAFLVLCTLESGENNILKDAKMAQYGSLQLKEIISGSLRRGDAYTQYCRTQYLILVIGNKTECEEVCGAIQQQFNHLADGKMTVQITCSPLRDLKPALMRQQAI